MLLKKDIERGRILALRIANGYKNEGDYKMAEHYKGMSIAFDEVQGKREDPSFIDMLEDMLKTFKKNK